MSLITRCPACGTMFRVVPDQLRISEGWVRCGHCADVFDASAHLQSQAAMTALPSDPPDEASDHLPNEASDQPQTPDAVEPLVAAFDESAAPASFGDEEIATGQEAIAAPMHRPALPDDEPEPEPELEQELSETPTAEDSGAAQEPPEDPTEERSEKRPEEQPEERPLAQEPQEPTESTIEDMSFVREARRKAFWRRGSVRAIAGVVCGVLLLVLALQVAVHERDRLAVLDPRAKPWLDGLCAPLGCEVAPLRQIEALVIESSSFNKVRGNAYRLNVSIRNKAPMPLAMPGIELALTDSQDQPVLRRVLLPADLGAAAVIASGAEWSASLPVSVTADGQAGRIAGYRLLAFYP